MANKVLSIEIGTHKTKICVIDFKKNNPRVYHTIIFDTPYDCIDDGYIKDKITLSSIIHEKLKEAKIKLNKVVFTISSSKIANREVMIPLVKKNKIQEIVNAGASDYFPINIGEYNISYSVLEKVNTKEDKYYRLLVLAVDNNLILSYFELAKQLDYHIEAIDYNGNSIFQLNKKQNQNESTSMFVQINEQNTLINILQQDVLILQRTISYGYDATIETIMETPFFDIKKEEQAEDLLWNYQMIHPRFDMAANDNVDKDEKLAQDDITESLRYLVNNILRVLDYYNTKYPNQRIQKIYLTGYGTKIIGIDKLISNEIGYELTLLKHLEGIHFVNNIQDNYVQSDFIGCIGAAIAPVGMVPKQYIEKAEKISIIQAMVVITTLAIATSIVLIILSNFMLEDAKSKNQSLQEKIDNLDGIDSIYNDYRNIQDAFNTMLSIDTYSYSYNDELGNLLIELENKLPTKVVIHSFRVTKTDIMLDLTVDSKDTAAMTLLQLKKVSFLTNVKTYSMTELTDSYGLTTIGFSVTANYTTPLMQEEGVK